MSWDNLGGEWCRVLWSARWAAVLLFGSLFGVVSGPGCRREFPDRPVPLVVGEADVLADGPLSFDESRIRVKVAGEDIVTEFYVTFANEIPVPIQGQCHLEQGLTHDTLESKPATFVVEDGQALGTCRFEDGRGMLADGALGAVVQVIEVTSSDGLYRVISHSSLRTLGQTRVDILGGDSVDDTGRGVIRALAHDVETGQVVSGVPVRIELSQGDRTWVGAEGITDDKGQVLLEYSVPDLSDAVTTIQAVAGLELGEVTSPQTTIRSAALNERLVLTTDKPIYQPEQNLFMRVAALRGMPGLPISGADAVFVVFDSKGRKVARFATRTNEYGIASAVMKLGRVIDFGTYRVEVDVGSAKAEKSITVLRYALPRFKATINLDASYYLPGQVMTGSVDAAYFFGKKVANGTVTLRAFTYVAGLDQFAEQTLFLDEQGSASFTISLPDRFYGIEFLQGNAFVLLQADVTDSAGQSETVSKSTVVAPSDVLVFVVPENARLAPGLVNHFLVETVSAAGVPLPCSVSLTKNGQELARAATDDNGIDRVSFQIPSSSLDVSVSATCEGGLTASRTVRLGQGEGTDQDGILLLVDGPTARVGEQVHVHILASQDARVVYLDIIHAGLPILSVPVNLEQGEARYDLTVSSDMVGLCQLRAYRISHEGVLVRNTRLLYVQPEDFLNIDLTTDRRVYRPGEMAHLDISVTDSVGQGTSAAVGLSVVDEAVFALTDLQPGLEKQFFDFEEELAEPSYQIKGCSFQDLQRADQDPGAEQRAQLYLASFNNADSFYAVQWSLSSVPLAASRTDEARLIANDASQVAQALDWKVDSVSDIEQKVAKMTLFDPWGRPYRPWAKDRRICLASLGADEIADTNDDFTEVCARIRYRSDEHPQGVDAGLPWGNDGGLVEDGSVGPDAQHETLDANLRKNFPETLFFRPSVITDNSGHARVDIPLADSITTWRVSAIASGAQGSLGSAQRGITVFQPFFLEPDLPAYLLNDTDITIPVVVYNYDTDSQDVIVTIQRDSWFSLLGSATRTVTVLPQSAASVQFPIHVLDVGRRSFRIDGHSADFSDSVAKSILVRPNGKEFSSSCAGIMTQGQGALCQVTYPAQRIDGADELLVKIYGKPAGHAVEGLDSMIREPFG